MTKKLKKLLIRIIIAAILFAALFTAEKTGLLGFLDGRWYAFVPWLVPYLIAGYDVLLKAAKNIAHGQVFDENFLMMIATFAAFGIGEYTEGVAVMVFYQIGEWFQQYAVGKSRKSISAMMEIVPEYANLVHDGEVTEEDPEDVHVDDIILIKPGERVPLDGVVLEGSSFLDQSSLTGESVPVRISEGQEILSGCINQSEVLKVRVTKEYVDSTVSRILELVENASSRKAKVENFITRFARIYTPVVTIAAVLLAVIPPLLFGQAWAEWIRRACTFLVISCPCALVISVPLGFFAGIGAASKLGVLVKGSNYLEILSNVRTMVFDKTGTLTRGEFSVAEVLPAEGVSRETLLRTAAQLEAYSNHPIAAALRAACKDAPEAGTVTKAEEIAGQGIRAVYEEKVHVIGNLKLMDAEGIPAACEGDVPTLLTMVLANRITGCSGFQCNPARVNTDNGEMLWAHCTIPLNMVEKYEYDSHFESGIGISIHADLPLGDYTLVKVSGDLQRIFAEDVQLVRNQYQPNLCRTQVWLKTKHVIPYLLSKPIANHHLLVPGHHAEAFIKAVQG